MSRTRILAGAVAVVAAALLVAVGRGSAGAPDRPGPVAAPAAPAGPAADPRGIVVLCLDTLRADALALDTGRAVRMPRLEAFAGESVAFADAVAPAAWTGPSITSLLTGLDPSHTGVLGLPERVGEPPSDVVAVASRLVAAGWDAAAVTTGGFVDPKSRVMRGFRETTVGLDQDPAAVIAGWDRRRPKGVPFFLFLHSLAAHDPYLDKDARAGRPADTHGFDAARAQAIRAVLADRPETLPEAEVRWLVETAIRSAVTRSLLTASLGRATADRAQGAITRWLDDASERDPTLGALGERLHAAYLEGLAYVDRLVGRILDALEALRLPEGTAVFVVADHGETFGERGTLLHGRRLFDELVRVPLLVRVPKRLGAPRVVRGSAGLVDVVPTVLELAGLPVPAGLDGISLVAALADGGGLPDRAMRAFEERRRHEHGVERIERLESIRTPRAKCIVRRDPATRRVLGAEVYDLLVDPLERAGIPLERVERPCEFGDAFARALEAAGFDVPCLQASVPAVR